MKLFRISELEEVENILYELNKDIGYDKILIEESLGRILYEDIISEINVPHFTRSTVDGYALNHRSVNGASETMPILIKVIEKINMNEVPEKKISLDEGSYVPTGGMIPEGADSVVMIEYVEKLSENEILVGKSVSPLENINSVGEDLEEGEMVFSALHKIKAYDMGVLAALGYKYVKVHKKMKIGIIATGDEIVEHDEMPLSGQMRNSNSTLLFGMSKAVGTIPMNYGIVTDDKELIKKTIEKALSECDMVLITGGSSVGERDHTINAIEEISGSEILVHGIAVKPGKPTIIAKNGKKIIFGLPGNPLAVLVIFKTLIEKYINKFIKTSECVSGVLTVNYHKAMGRAEFLPVKLIENTDRIYVEPIMAKSSSVAALSKAYGFILIEKNKEGIHKGEQVEIYKI